MRRIRSRATVGGMLLAGEWSGHYVMGNLRYPQRQRLTFTDGAVRGAGSDALGPFDLEGEYVAVDPDHGRIGWIKTYRGAHSVLYLGTYAPGRIWGDWFIGDSGDTFQLEPAHRSAP